MAKKPVYYERQGGEEKHYTTGKHTYYGIAKADWANLLSKGSSLATLKTADLAYEAPEVTAMEEKQKLISHRAKYKRVWWWHEHIGDVFQYKGLGMDATMGEGNIGFKTAKSAQEQVKRVLGVFAKRKEEASLRQRAPGRAATMLTTKNKTQLTGY